MALRGINVHIGVDAESSLIHTVECTTAKTVSDITTMDSCLHGEEALAFGDRRSQENQTGELEA